MDGKALIRAKKPAAATRYRIPIEGPAVVLNSAMTPVDMFLLNFNSKRGQMMFV